MNRSSPDVTLQINVCAGDVSYCDQIVPALVAVHRKEVREVIAVMDCCRPQSTPVVYRRSRFPAQIFAQRLGQLEACCARWLKEGIVDRVIRLEEHPGQLRDLNLKYSGSATAATHDHLGHASAAYYLGWEKACTRYVVHFDGDILFYQQGGYSWLAQAVAALERDARIVAVSPRISPPPARSELDSLVNLSRMPECGWSSTWPLESVAEGWSSSWFSTRCHLLDRERLFELLPLTPTRGRAAYRRGGWCHAFLAPLFDLPVWTAPIPLGGVLNVLLRAVRKVGLMIPAFPLPPEVLMHENNQRLGARILYLKDPRAWFLHPASKPEVFHQFLPAMLKSISRGEFPSAQAGMCDIDFSAWEMCLSEAVGGR